MILGKYNQTKTVYFDLFQVDGVDFEPAATFATGDVKIMKDEGAEANTTNLPADEGQGYSLVLTATEMSAARIKIYVVDQTGTKVWLDTGIHVETYGNASAEHAFDLDTASTPQTADHTAGIADIPTVAEFNARSLVAASYTIVSDLGVVQTADHTAGIADIPTVAEFNARTLLAAAYTIVADLGTVQSADHASAIADIPTVAEFNARTLVAASYALASELAKVPKSDSTVSWNATALAAINAEADTALSDYDGPTNAEMVARTLVAADYFDAAADAVALSATGLDAIASTATGMVEIAKAIWDRVLTGATHNISSSAGRRLRALSGIILADGVAQSGGTNSIQLASGDVTINDQFRRAKVIITAGTGAGQEVIITNSVASTDTLTVTPAWLVNPDATSEYEILPGQTHSTIRNGGYDNGFVYLDVVNGASGTIIGVSGTTTNKSDNPADARTIADVESIRQFMISGGGAWSLDQAYTYWVFEHVSASLITLNSQDITGSVFMRSGITGTASATATSVFELCGMLNATVGICNFLQCGFEGTITLANTDQYLAWNCFENSSTMPIIDVNGDGATETTLNLVEYNGRIEIKGMTSVDVVTVTGNVHLTINVDCTGGTITYAGDVAITDNASGSVTLVQGEIADILDDTAEIGTAGAGLTDLGGMSTGMSAEILVEANAALDTAIAELGVAAPSATPTTRTALMLMYMALRNKLVVQTSGTDALEIHNNAGTKIASKLITDDGSDYTEAEMS